MWCCDVYSKQESSGEVDEHLVGEFGFLLFAVQHSNESERELERGAGSAAGDDVAVDNDVPGSSLGADSLEEVGCGVAGGLVSENAERLENDGGRGADGGHGLGGGGLPLDDCDQGVGAGEVRRSGHAAGNSDEIPVALEAVDVRVRLDFDAARHGLRHVTLYEAQRTTVRPSSALAEAIVTSAPARTSVSEMHVVSISSEPSAMGTKTRLALVVRARLEVNRSAVKKSTFMVR